MRASKIIKSEVSNYYIKKRGIPKGCELCLEGAKAVFFLNGICQRPPHCAWYCPISEERRGNNVNFIDEIQIEEDKDILREIETINAKGMSITGGEPLMEANYKRTLKTLRLVKRSHNKDFHVHLYTNGLEFTEQKGFELKEAGLDEIRFHPDKQHWSNIALALDKGMSVGVELPVIPKRKYLEDLKELIFYLDDIGVEFINLNEFELCSPNSEKLKQEGFFLKEGTIAVVKGSREAAYKLMRQVVDEVSMKMHFCSIKAKDHYQLKNRYLRRATTIRRPYETISEEGLLIFGQVEGNAKKIDQLKQLLINELAIPVEYLHAENDFLMIDYLLLIDDDFESILKDLKLEGYVMEIIPFRGKYREITEKTPLETFKQEQQYHED